VKILEEFGYPESIIICVLLFISFMICCVLLWMFKLYIQHKYYYKLVHYALYLQFRYQSITTENQDVKDVLIRYSTKYLDIAKKI
jgi:hypothetical protein